MSLPALFLLSTELETKAKSLQPWTIARLHHRYNVHHLCERSSIAITLIQVSNSHSLKAHFTLLPDQYAPQERCIPLPNETCSREVDGQSTHIDSFHYLCIWVYSSRLSLILSSLMTRSPTKPLMKHGLPQSMPPIGSCSGNLHLPGLTCSKSLRSLLLMHHLLSSHLLPFNYFSVSKLCCYPFHALFHAYNKPFGPGEQKYFTMGFHNKLYPLWPVPVFGDPKDTHIRSQLIQEHFAFELRESLKRSRILAPALTV